MGWIENVRVRPYAGEEIIDFTELAQPELISHYRADRCGTTVFDGYAMRFTAKGADASVTGKTCAVILPPLSF